MSVLRITWQLFYPCELNIFSRLSVSFGKHVYTECTNNIRLSSVLFANNIADTHVSNIDLIGPLVLGVLSTCPRWKPNPKMKSPDRGIFCPCRTLCLPACKRAEQVGPKAVAKNCYWHKHTKTPLISLLICISTMFCFKFYMTHFCT